jgi:hypothetical protein
VLSPLLYGTVFIHNKMTLLHFRPGLQTINALINTTTARNQQSDFFTPTTQTLVICYAIRAVVLCNYPIYTFLPDLNTFLPRVHFTPFTLICFTPVTLFYTGYTFVPSLHFTPFTLKLKRQDLVVSNVTGNVIVMDVDFTGSIYEHVDVSGP